MELYYIIAITDHDRGEAMGSLYYAAGLHLILSMPARGTATSEHLAIYGLDATEKCVIAAVGSAQEADSLIRSAKRKLFIDIPGNGVMLTGGGAQLHGLTEYLSQELKVEVTVSPDPVNCVALGTAQSLSIGDKLETGFTDATPRIGRR